MTVNHIDGKSGGLGESGQGLMSSQGPVDSDGAETAGASNQKDYLQEGFNALLHPNELEALVDL